MPEASFTEQGFFTFAREHPLEEKMASLLHEVWEHEHGMVICLAGYAMTASLPDNARLVATFEASSDAEAMSKYYALYDMGAYKPFDSSALEPYSDELKVHQLRTIQR